MTGQRTSEQPVRTILRRYRDTGGIQWADLECGHTEPCTTLPVATALRCRECLPVRITRPTDAPNGDGPNTPTSATLDR